MIHSGPFNHAADEGHAYQRDEQEAHSLRYGHTAFMILPLSSGKIAVLGHMRDLHAICDTFEEALEAGRTIPMLVWRRKTETLAPPTPRVPVGLDLSTIDLDL